MPNGSLRLGTFRSLWASKEVDASPALHFIRPQQVVELSPFDAERLGVTEGERGRRRRRRHARGGGRCRLRAAIPHGSVFLAAGTAEQPANRLTESLVAVQRVGPPRAPEPSAQPAIVTPGVEGLSEALPSAPQPDPGRPPARAVRGRVGRVNLPAPSRSRRSATTSRGGSRSSRRS